MTEQIEEIISAKDLDAQIAQAEEEIKTKRTKLDQITQELRDLEKDWDFLRHARERFFPQRVRVRAKESDLFLLDTSDLSEMTIPEAMRIVLFENGGKALTTSELHERLAEKRKKVHRMSITIALRRFPEIFKITKRGGRICARLTTEAQKEEEQKQALLPERQQGQ